MQSALHEKGYSLPGFTLGKPQISKKTSPDFKMKIHESNLKSVPITEITNKENDVQTPEQKKDSSSSFSESELITILAGLMALIPEQHRKPSVEKTIERGLNAHGTDYVKMAVLYSVAGSNGNTTQFKAYLSKCIENNWHDGWEPGFNQEDIEKKKEAFLASRRNMPNDMLKADAENGCQASTQVLSERGI